ncbi:carbohydrate ABC transporter permease [Microbacterium aurantiacum]|uniref:carbohydrate ABC transporter permease n=1 Tax=Microbacterium aurantiacum TaxID=162393 RepID=UPI00287BC53D|nr:sugar ABC transporter permease [Microbacterium aurantiacum]
MAAPSTLEREPTIPRAQAPAPPPPVRRSRVLSARRLPFVFATPAVLLVAVMLVVPLVYTIVLSTTSAEGSLNRPMDFIGLQNYWTALTDSGRFWPAVMRTAVFTIAAVVIELVLGLGIALLLQKPFRGRGAVRLLILLPLVATPVAVSMMWLLIFEPSIGFANQLLGWLGIPAQGFLSDPAQSMPVLIFIDAWQWTPMIALILMAGLTTVPEEPVEAAMMDGANAWQRFFHVVLPIIWPTVLVAVLLRSIDALKTFDLIYALKGPGGGPFHEAETLNILVYTLTFAFGEFGYASAVLMLFFILVVAFCAVLVLSRRRGDLPRASKGKRIR